MTLTTNLPLARLGCLTRTHTHRSKLPTAPICISKHRTFALLPPKLTAATSNPSSPLPRRASSSFLAGTRHTTSQTRPYAVSKTGNPEEPHVLSTNIYSNRILTLNRRKALNALSHEMITTMTDKITAWKDSDLCKTITLTSSSSPRAFCAGGDVRSLAATFRKTERNVVETARYFEDEYRLNHLVATLRKPYVAILDGVTMGGGAGISVHGAFRVATENTVFAMPETAIGLFPDVGASFFLPRLDGWLGTYLGLTGRRLKGQDVVYAGIATHYVPSSRIPQLMDRLNELDSGDHDVVALAIDEFAENLSTSPDSAIGGEDREIVDRCFSKLTVQGIVDALKKEEEGKGSTFARDTIAQLERMSPLSLKITLHLLRKGKSMNLQACLQMEYNLASLCLEHGDFSEGVAALLVEKRPARWSPPTLAEVDDDVVRGWFGRASNKKIEFSNHADFDQYPYRRFAGPSESDVNGVVAHFLRDNNRLRTAGQIERHFYLAARGKHGVREKVRNVLQRKCVVDEEGGVAWKI